MKKLGIIFLTLTFLFSTFGLLPVKRVSANTEEERPLLMIAGWPWDFYLNPKGSNHNPGSSTKQHPVKNQRGLKKSTAMTVQPGDSNKQSNYRSNRDFRDWFFKISPYLRILFR